MAETIGSLINGSRTPGYAVQGALDLTAHIHPINPRRAVGLNTKDKIIKLLENRKKKYDLNIQKDFLTRQQKY